MTASHAPHRTYGYVSPGSAEAYGLSDTDAVVLPDEPTDTRHQKALDALLAQPLTGEASKVYRQILSVFPSGTLEALKKHGLAIEITQGQAVQGVTASGATAVGGYDPSERRIMVDQAILTSNLGRHVMTHEMIHAIDHMRGERAGSAKRLASTTDAELKTLFSQYMARGAVESVGQIRANIKAKEGVLPPKTELTVEDNWGAMAVHYEQRGDNEVIRIEQQPRDLQGKIQDMMREQATGSKGGKDLPRVEVDVDLQRGGQAHVVQQGTVSVVTLPKNSVTFTGDIWSDYAHRSAMPEEYTAEAFSHYLENGSKRDEMTFVDPDMLAYTERVLNEEFNLHP